MVVTPLYAALLVLWFLVLTLRVLQNRQSTKVSLGDGGNTLLQRAIRGHANFAEYVPLGVCRTCVRQTPKLKNMTNGTAKSIQTGCVSAGRSTKWGNWVRYALSGAYAHL